MERLKERLAAKAVEEGVSAMRVTRPDAIPEAMARLQAFREAGHHGQMSWMADRVHWRGDPAALWPEARSVIMLAEAYTPEHDPRSVVGMSDRAAISVYAQNRDYHDLVKKRLKRLGRWLIDQAPEAEIKVFVDTAPVMEKPLAEAAGLGWQASTRTCCRAIWGIGSFWGRFLRPWSCPLTRPRCPIAGPVGPVWRPVRRGRFPRPISWMRGGAFLT